MKMTGERFIPGRMMKHAEVEHMHRYYAVSEVLKNKTVLDAACGTGYGSSIIAKYADQVVGIDISGEAVEYARERYGSDKVTYHQGSIEKLDFPDRSFDVVVSFETIEHVEVELQNKFLDEISRVLKDDGILIMSTPNKKIYTDEEYGSQSEWHVHEFYEEEYEVFLKRRFQYVKWYHQFICKASYLLESAEAKAGFINLDQNKKGKFFITVAGKQPIHPSYNLSSVYYYPERYDRVNDYVQIYYKTEAEEFSEKKYELLEIEAKPGIIIEEKIVLDGERARWLRFDPMSKSCRLKVHPFEIAAKDGSKIETLQFITNADVREDDLFVFMHDDPQFIFDLEQEMEIEYIKVNFEILEVSLDLYPQLIKEKKEAMLNGIKAREWEEKYNQLKAVLDRKQENGETNTGEANIT